MFEKIQDLLVVLVLAYSVYKIGWIDGWTTINVFILACSAMAVLAMILRRSGYLKRTEQKKRDSTDKDHKK